MSNTKIILTENDSKLRHCRSLCNILHNTCDHLGHLLVLTLLDFLELSWTLSPNVICVMSAQMGGGSPDDILVSSSGAFG